MQANEALEVLGLRPGATPVQIKEAYRDLVKVWHPDRFGSDMRLRQKAEEKLQQINEAYRVLESGEGVRAEAGVTSTPRYSSSSASRPVAARRRGGSNRVAMGWFYWVVGISLVVFAVYMVMEHAAMRPAGSQPAPVEPVASSSASETPSGVPAGHGGRPAGTSGRASKDAKGNGAGAAFAVHSLSDAESSRLEVACEPQRERGQTAYQVCLAAQVALMTNPAGLPDLSALNGSERESIESACGEVRRTRGADGYNRCLTAKMAEWAAEPARPRLSKLNEADRASVELACRGTKEREGPAAYDRCLVRFTKALAEAR